MKIKSNALPHELDSPFYLANKKFCEVFERFIASKKGKVKGRYNAFSYMVYGKIKAPKNWGLNYKRAVYSSTGNLLFSSKSQSLLVLIEWTCENFATPNTSFFIRRRKFLDLLNPLYSNLANHKKYVIRSKGETKKVLSSLVTTLQPLFESKEIYRISCKNSRLTIELRSETHHFDVFNELIQLS